MATRFRQGTSMRTYLRVAAIIFHKDKLVIIRMKKGKSVYYILPGGGVEDYETIYEAIKREVKEETNLEITKFRLVYIRELNIKDKGRGVEFYFYVKEYKGKPQKGFDPEIKKSTLEGIELVSPDKLSNFAFYPKQLISTLKQNKKSRFNQIKHLGLDNYP